MRALIACLLCVSATTAHGQYQYTPAETAHVQKLASQVQAACQKEIQAKLAKKAGAASSVIAGATPAYCGCLADSVRNDVPPTMLRSSQTEAFKKFMGTATEQCTLREFKNLFPNICRSWFGGLPAREGAEAKEIETRLDRFCECAQQSVDNLRPDGFKEIMSATTQDFEDYKRSPEGFLSIRTGSLLPQWLACRQRKRIGQQPHNYLFEFWFRKSFSIETQFDSGT